MANLKLWDPVAGAWTPIGAVPEGIQVPLDGWHNVGAAGEPAFASPWKNLAGAGSGVGFTKTPDGRVHLRGTAQAVSATGTAATIFTLPVGYRPAGPDLWIHDAIGSMTTGRVDVYVDGRVACQAAAAANGWISLNHIVFDTESVTSYATGYYGPVAPSFVTSLPSNPTDGQEVYYLADAANGVVWHLRYRAASASAYKWEVVGGSDIITPYYSPANTLGGGSSWSSQLTDGTANVKIIPPLAGDYDVKWTCSAYIGNTVTQNTGVGVAKTGDAGPQAVAQSGVWASAGGVMANFSGSGRVLGVDRTNGAFFMYLYTAQIITFLNRQLAIRPVRVG